jgi:endonuclease/exonuclease/phosphatase family metal-dependent hydrolase
MTAYRTVNLAWQLPNDIALIRASAEGVDVLGFVESRNFRNQPVDVAAVLGDDWDVVQDCTSAAHAGCAIAVRRGSGVEIRSWRLRLMSSGVSGKVQARYLLVAYLRDHGKRVRVFVCHLPLESTGVHDEALTVVKRAVRRARTLGRFMRWIVMGDVNMEPDEFAAELHAPHHFGSSSMTIAWSHGWQDAGASKRRIAGSDHWVLSLFARGWK